MMKNRNEDMTLKINENNASENTTPESIISAQNASQTETSATTQLVRSPTRIVSPRQNTHDRQSNSETFPHRNITSTFPPSPEEAIQDRTQKITSSRDISVKVLSPTITISNNTRNTTRPVYDPPSVPSVFKYPNKTIQPQNQHNNNNQPTSSQLYDPFNYSFFPPFNTNIQSNNTENVSQFNNKINSVTQHPYTHLLQTNPSQSKFPSQNQRTSYSNIVQPSQRKSQSPPLSHISTDPLYQMNQHTTYNPATISPPVNMVQSVVPPPHYIPIQQDTFINTSASIPEPMKHFDGLDHSYTPEEYLQQVEAKLTFAIGQEPQNNSIKYKSWHNSCMVYIQCSLVGTALEWYTDLHLSYKQQWISFVHLFKKQFSSQKTTYYAQVETMSLMKKDNEIVHHFALRVQQSVKKGWSNENVATINLENNEIFTKRLPKKLKDFAHKGQVKYVSTLLEPSIPFHTLVRHVDYEDIANEKNKNK